jgi:alpha-tubulin suppressor-like RCC1 family protein
MSYKTLNSSNYPKLQLSQIGKQINSSALYGWGYNGVGQLGNLSYGQTYTNPVKIAAPPIRLKSIALSQGSSFAIQSNGTLWTWGYESFGQLGNNTTTNQFQYTPIQIGNVSTWTQVTSGFLFSAALQSNGTLWSWGYNGTGTLGLGDLTNRSSPVQVGNLSNWAQIFGGGQSKAFFAIQSNGTLWTCGYNGHGELGLGDLTDRSSLTQVGTLSIWTQIATGYQQNIAIATQYF